MRPGGDGLPNAADIVQIQKNSAGPVGLTSGPGGDIFYPGFNDGGLHRLRYSGNLPPTASISTDVSSGLAPLTVNFSATSSTDPENGALTYAWDLDGDGAFDDGFAGNAQWTYTTGGVFKPRVLVTDAAGLADVAATTILVNNSAPTAVIDTPSASTTWRVGNTIAFTGHATDPDQPGGLPASALTWEVVIHHCPSNCHLHSMQSFVGVASGSFAAPDHEYPSFLELRLTATDATGLQHTASIDLHPQTVALTFQSNPSGLQLAVNAASAGTPFSRTVIIGSSNSVSAAAQQMLGGVTYQFTSWSDGLSANHNVVAPAVATTYTANYAPVALSNLVAAYGMNESSGTTVSDWTAKGHTGTISGAAWTASGKFGGALSFDGVDDLVTIADANDLDLTTAMTLEAWLYPTASGGGSWRNVLIKERTGGEVYNLYSNADTNAPVIYAVRAADPGAPLDARGTTQLPLNTWSHVAVTFDNVTLRLFVNGVQAGTRAVSGPLLTSTGALRLGGNSIWGEYFAGRIDEVRIYNRALAASEIQADMNSAVGAPDTTPPVRSAGAPSGVLNAGTASTTLSLTTNENATCRYATSAGVPYASMTQTFATTGTTSHSTGVTGLVGGGSYTYYVRCQDGDSNSNPDDFLISFSVAQDTAPADAFQRPALGHPAGRHDTDDAQPDDG